MPWQLQQLSTRKRPTIRIVVGLAVVFCVVVCLFTAREIWRSRQDKLESAEVTTSNIARVLALHAESTFRVADLVLENIVERAEKDGFQGASRDRLRTHLERSADRAAELHGLFLYDERGAWVATSLRRRTGSKDNNADREYFQYHRTHTDRQTRIGSPVRSRSSGVWIIPVSRRIDHADGSFAGVALATLRLNFFEHVYDKLDVGSTGTIILALDDGMLLYRRPFAERMVGMNISSGPVMHLYRQHGPVGTAMLVAKIDGIKRLYSYRHLEGFPLIVAAALSAEEIYAGWRELALRLLASLAFFIAVIAFFGNKLIRQLALRDLLEQKLRTMADDLVRANGELSLLAMHDSLTRIANRRAFDHALPREFARAAREGTPISLIMLDVDHFKQFNDNYGHPAGDACLHQLAGAILAQVTRQTDLAARYGGEEFVVLLPSTDSAGAQGVAEKIRHAIHALHIPHAFSPEHRVTVSIGVATFHAFDPGQHVPDELLKLADAALYTSKRGGRNRVTFRGMGA